MEVNTIVDLARGYEDGRNPVEDPSRFGGIFVDEETLALAADMETALALYERAGRPKAQFFRDLLEVLERANETDEDQINAVKDWLGAWLKPD